DPGTDSAVVEDAGSEAGPATAEDGESLIDVDPSVLALIGALPESSTDSLGEPRPEGGEVAAATPDETEVVDTAAEDAAATEQPAGERTDAPVDEGASPDTVDDAATTEQPAQTRSDGRVSSEVAEDARAATQEAVDTAAEDAAAATEQPAGERTDAPVDEGASHDKVDDEATTEQPEESREAERDTTDTHNT